MRKFMGLIDLKQSDLLKVKLKLLLKKSSQLFEKERLQTRQSSRILEVDSTKGELAIIEIPMSSLNTLEEMKVTS